MMHLYFPHKIHESKARRVPESVKNYMVKRFRLLPEYLDTLKCFEYREVVANRDVRRFSIFSPYKAKQRHISINTRADLMQHRDLLEYEGHIDLQGTVYVADRREPTFRAKISGQSLV